MLKGFPFPDHFLFGLRLQFPYSKTIISIVLALQEFLFIYFSILSGEHGGLGLAMV